MSRNQSSIRLPKALLEELEHSSGNHSNKQRHRAPRKEARKLDRLETKKRKAEHFASTRQAQDQRAHEEHTDTPKPKRYKQEQPAPRPKAKQTPLQKLVERSQKPVAPSASHRDQQEDSYITYLESKLGWKKNGMKTGAYGSGLGDDGLDDLLGDLDMFGSSKAKDVGFDNDEETDEEIDEDSSEDDSSSTAEDADAYEEWGGFEESADDSSVSLQTDTVQQVSEEAPQKSEQGSRYLPPHMRKLLDNEQNKNSEAMIKLNKQLKGLLNRLSEQNISSILDSVEEMYRTNRRNDVTSVLTTQIIDGISSHSVHLDSYVVLYAAFIASLHRLVGVEFAAFFMQNVVTSYESHLEAVSPSSTLEADAHGKEASNLIVLLSELYNFQVISCVLVYDIIRGLLSRPHLTEYHIELLLKITRSSGLQLRQDDPSALKDIIQMIHVKLNGQKDSTSSRTNFMIETLTNLKNNKLKKAVAGGAGGTGGPEAVERLKKFISGMSKKRHVMSHEPLRVTLEDLHSAETKGKWWLVGAAWNGDPLVDRKTNPDPAKGGKRLNDEDKLIKLAKKQGMNTDIRRSIFVVIMSSEDYVDACERLGQLKLTEVQQREIVRVLLHCCGNERSYNPYYTLICQHLCRMSHSYKVTLQFCMWDFLRELGESNVGGIELLKRQQDEGFATDDKVVGKTKLRNVARAYAWWIAKDCCSLTILKPVDFTILKAQTHGFLKELLLQTFVSSQISTPALAENTRLLLQNSSRNRAALEEIFAKVTHIETLAMGLLYFVSEAFRKDSKTEDFLKWAVDVVQDRLRTGVDVDNDL